MKHKSLYQLRHVVSSHIEHGYINKALGLVHDCVEHIITNPLCTAQVNGSKILDDLCRSIGKRNLIDINISSQKKRVLSRPIYLYIVTRLQNSGGHSRVIENFILARPNAKHIILLTELSGKSDCIYFAKNVGEAIELSIEFAPRGNFQKKLTWIQQRLIETHPDHAYLFNHPQDSVAVAAIQPSMGLRASFYHHADHHLCLGVCLPDIEHIDIHSAAYSNCRKILGIENTFVPLMVDDKGMRPSSFLFRKNGALTTCTAGRSNKVESPYFIHYLQMIPELLKNTRGKHIHIGKLTLLSLWRLRWSLKRHKIDSERFIYIPWVSSVWQTLQDLDVDLYIASFPYGGGLTLIEAMGAGVPVALHDHIYSNLLGSIYLAYKDVFSWRYPEELYTYCASVTDDTLRQHANLGREHYHDLYRRDTFNTLINRADNNTLPLHADESGYSKQIDEWACWMANQLNFRKLLLREVYRIYRRARRVFF